MNASDKLDAKKRSRVKGSDSVSVDTSTTEVMPSTLKDRKKRFLSPKAEGQEKKASPAKSEDAATDGAHNVPEAFSKAPARPGAFPHGDELQREAYHSDYSEQEEEEEEEHGSLPRVPMLSATTAGGSLSPIVSADVVDEARERERDEAVRNFKNIAVAEVVPSFPISSHVVPPTEALSRNSSTSKYLVRGSCGIVVITATAVIITILVIQRGNRDESATQPTPSTDAPTPMPSLMPSAFTLLPRQCFESSEELSNVVDEYFSYDDSARKMALGPKYGYPIGAWCVKKVTIFSKLFDNERNPLATTFNDDISRWDVARATDMSRMFRGAAFNQNLSLWDVSKVMTMKSLFDTAAFFNQDISSWNTSSVTDMTMMFYHAASFDRSLSTWDVSNVVSLAQMFEGAPLFNQDISSWNTSRVVDMTRMFFSALAFNQSISSWITSNVNSMESMFSKAGSYNQPMSSWDVSNVSLMASMFEGATVFNNEISNWNTSLLNDMTNLFRGAEAMNQPLSTWDVSNVYSMAGTFENNQHFNQDISAWDTSSVNDMSRMFMGAQSFDQDISAWDTSGVEYMSMMFMDAQSFNVDISDWDASFVFDMSNMFMGAQSFNQSISKWVTSSVVSMSEMFVDAQSFNQDLQSWNVSSVTVFFKMFNGAASFNQNLCPWGRQIQLLGLDDGDVGRHDDYVTMITPAINVTDMFVGTSCLTEDDPDLHAVPPGPFCHPCTESS